MSCKNINSESLNKKILNELRLTSTEYMLFICMDDFYNNKDNTMNAQELDKLLNGNISIRLIDFFVTNYSLKNRVTFKIDNKNNILNVYSLYKDQLKAWKKVYFDPFSRGTRIPFFFNNNQNCLLTTIGQLNFFKWFITNNISKYIKLNINKIEYEMNKNKKIIKPSFPKIKQNKKYNKNKNYNSYNIANSMILEAPKKQIKIEVYFN